MIRIIQYTIRQRICTVLAVFFLISGCATYNRKSVSHGPVWEDAAAILKDVQGEVQNLSLKQICDTVIANNTKLDTFRGKMKLSLTMPDVKGPIRCTGLILYQRPQSLRAICSKFTSTIFDLSSDGQTFWLYIPSENTVYTGASNRLHRVKMLNSYIFPNDVTRLFNYMDILKKEKPMVETWPRYWLVHLLDIEQDNAAIKGNLSIDRVNGDVFRCEFFNPDGTIRFQAVFTDYAEYRGCRIPQKIDVRWPVQHMYMSITFTDITVNDPLDPEVFMPLVPQKTQLIALD